MVKSQSDLVAESYTAYEHQNGSVTYIIAMRWVAESGISVYYVHLIQKGCHLKRRLVFVLSYM